MRFNGYDLSGLLVVEEIRRQLVPTVDNVLVRRPGRDGAEHVRTTYGTRLTEVDIRLIERDRDALQQAIRSLAGRLYTRGPARLDLHDDPDKYEMAVLDGAVDVDKLLYTGGATLVFVSPEPASYSNHVQTVEIGPGYIRNVGTYPATGVITVTLDEPVASLRVTQLETGDMVHIDHALVENDVVVIDLGAESVTKNGASIMADVSLSSDFFEIPTGKFKITVTAGVAVLRYRARWI